MILNAIVITLSAWLSIPVGLTVLFGIGLVNSLEDWIPLRPLFYLSLIVVTWVVYGGIFWW